MAKIDYLILVCVVAAVFVCFFLLAPPGAHVHDLQEALDREHRRNEQLEEKVAEYERQIEKIKRNDATEIEAIARDRLGYCREGEEVYPMELLEKPQVAPSAPAPSTAQ